MSSGGTEMSSGGTGRLVMRLPSKQVHKGSIPLCRSEDFAK